MAVTLTREFYINFGLFLFACIALGLSIWAFAKPCKKDGFGDTMTNSESKSCTTPDDCNPKRMEVCVDSIKNKAINKCAKGYCECRSQISVTKYECEHDDDCPKNSNCSDGVCYQN